MTDRHAYCTQTVYDGWILILLFKTVVLGVLLLNISMTAYVTSTFVSELRKK